MIFEIVNKKFFDIFEAEIKESSKKSGKHHISSFIELHDHLGLEYVESAFYAEKNKQYHTFKFKVIDEKRFMIAKLKYEI